MRASLAVSAIVGALASSAAAQPTEQAVTVAIYQSQFLRLGQSIARVSVGSTDVADVAAFPPDQVLVTGKRIGQTSATVWFKNDEVAVLHIVVGYPVEDMTAVLKKAIPGGKDLHVTNAGSTAVLTGEVPDVADSERAEEALRGFLVTGGGSDSGAAQLSNLLTVPGDQQVQLEVSFAEVSRSALKQAGINFWARTKAQDFTGGVVSPTSSLGGIQPDAASGLQLSSGMPIISAPLSGAFGLVFSTAANSKFPFAAALSVLAQTGYARTLSEPTLVALSGRDATFLAGGEFPVPVPAGQGQLGIEYKEFGVQLKFAPTVVNDTIQLNLDTSVSDIDQAVGVRTESISVPGVTTRRSTTTIRLRDGQSFVIAGLLSDRVRSSIDKIPGIGDLPVLGALFRSTSYRREETELLVVVTAHIVRPQDDRPGLPGGDTATDPSDLELFLLGSQESKPNAGSARSAQPAHRRKEPAGPVGFAR